MHKLLDMQPHNSYYMLTYYKTKCATIRLSVQKDSCTFYVSLSGIVQVT